MGPNDADMCTSSDSAGSVLSDVLRVRNAGSERVLLDGIALPSSIGTERQKLVANPCIHPVLGLCQPDHVSVSLVLRV